MCIRYLYIIVLCAKIIYFCKYRLKFVEKISRNLRFCAKKRLSEQKKYEFWSNPLAFILIFTTFATEHYQETTIPTCHE